MTGPKAMKSKQKTQKPKISVTLDGSPNKTSQEMYMNQLETIRSDESSLEMTSNEDDTPFLNSVTDPTSRDPEVIGPQNGYAGRK